MIPEEANAEFVCAMEQVLEVYQRPYDPSNPVVCMDESPCQLIGETRKPFRDTHGVEHADYEYVRNGVASVFVAFEPLAGRRMIHLRDTHKGEDFTAFMREVARMHPQVAKVTVVLDNLSTHKKSIFYNYLPPQEAKALADRFEFVYTPKHGSWLNMAEIELRILKKQCLSRRMPDKETMQEQIKAWAADRNNKAEKADWQFSIDQARIKLKRLYPKVGS
jgi:transposase